MSRRWEAATAAVSGTRYMSRDGTGNRRGVAAACPVVVLGAVVHTIYTGLESAHFQFHMCVYRRA